MIITKQQFVTLLVIGAAILAATTFAVRTNANPSAFDGNCSTAAATSTRTYMTAGTATTTLTCNLQTGTTFAMDSGSLLVIFTASSTSSTLNVNVECSDQNANDWYQNCLLTDSATTSPTISALPAPAFQWRFASSTPGLGVLLSDNNQDGRIFNIKVPTERVRFIFTLPTGSSNGAVWAKFIGKRETVR